MSIRYDRPSTIARWFNEAFRLLAEAGVSVAGSAAIRVRGRTTGRLRGVVVNPVSVDGRRYLVSPRGNTQWARNVRAAGEVEMGPRWRSSVVTAHDVSDDAKPAILRPYLERWFWQLDGHVGGLTPTSSDAELRAVSPTIPIFELR